MSGKRQRTDEELRLQHERQNKIRRDRRDDFRTYVRGHAFGILKIVQEDSVFFKI